MDRHSDHGPNKQEHEHKYDNNISRDLDDSRPPQLNSEVPGQGQLSQGCQDMGEGDGHGGSDVNFPGVHATMQQNGYIDDDNASEDGAEPFGQEGVEDNQLRPSRLESRCECSCHFRVTFGGRMYWEPGTPIHPAARSLESSMMVEHGSNGEQSAEDSMLQSTRSSTPSEFSVFIGEMFVNEITFPPTNQTHTFLPLLPLLPELSLVRNYYPPDLSTDEDSENEN